MIPRDHVARITITQEFTLGLYMSPGQRTPVFVQFGRSNPRHSRCNPSDEGTSHLSVAAHVGTHLGFLSGCNSVVNIRFHVHARSQRVLLNSSHCPPFLVLLAIRGGSGYFLSLESWWYLKRRRSGDLVALGLSRWAISTGSWWPSAQHIGWLGRG